MKENHQMDLTPRRLLILPVFIAIIAMVIVFLAISWSIRSAQLLLPKVNSLRREFAGRD